MKLKEKALIKDLELQIDYLICYAPQGWHWKKEYHFRQDLIDLTLNDASTPPEVVEKINKVQESLYRLRNQEHHDQGYIKYSQDEYKARHKVIVNDNIRSQQYYIEI